MRFVSLNGRLLAEKDAVIPITDRGFRFGDGIFETIRVHSGVPYHFEWHIGRLRTGLAAIKLSYDTASLKSSCAELIRRNGCEEGLLRIQITRGSSGQGYLPKGESPTCVIETLPLFPVPDEPVSLWLSDWRRIPESALPVRSKLCQGMNSTLARMQAQEHGCFDSLQLNQQGIVCETSSANIFWSKQNTLFTAALDCGVLEGATREILCRLAQPVHTIHAGLDDLKAADAVCVTNVAWGVVPVAGLKPSGTHWESSEMARELGNLLRVDIEKDCRKHAGDWQMT